MEQDFKSYYESTLLPDLTQLEADRKSVVGSLNKVMIIILTTVLLVTLTIYFSSGADFPFIVLLVMIVLGTIAYFIAYSIYTKTFRSDFKSKIIGVIIKFIDPNLKYEPTACISPDEYKASGLFKKSYDRYSGEDLIGGKVGETEIKFSELHTEYKTQHTDSKGRTKTSWHTIFKGVFFLCDFNKHFQTKVFVLPDTAEKLLGKWGQKLQSINKSHGNLIKLEDPEFEKEFAIYGDDQVEARYILSTSLMKRILDFKRKSGSVIYMSFVNSKLNVAISMRKNLFEPRVFKTILDYQFIKTNLDYLLLFTGIVEDLNLNTRIWTKV